jgi:hypothetical protein
METQQETIVEKKTRNAYAGWQVDSAAARTAARMPASPFSIPVPSAIYSIAAPQGVNQYTQNKS